MTDKEDLIKLFSIEDLLTSKGDPYWIIDYSTDVSWKIRYEVTEKELPYLIDTLVEEGLIKLFIYKKVYDRNN